MGINEQKNGRLARNSLYGLFSWLLPLAPSIIITPVLIRYLGAADYGLYLAILGLTSYFFTLGAGKIATKYVAQFSGKEDSSLVLEYVTATLIIATLPTLICLAGLLLCSSWVLREVLRLDPSSAGVALPGIGLAALTILSGGITQVWLGTIQGLHRFRRYFWIANATSVISSAGVLLIALAGGGVLALLGWSALVGFASLCLSLFSLKAVYPELRLTRVRAQVWWEVCTYAMSIFGSQLFGLLLLLFERGLIIREFGLDALSFYVVPMNLAVLIPALTGSFTLAAFPVLNENLADREAITGIYSRYSRLVLILGIFAITTAGACGGTFFRLWLGQAFESRSGRLLLIHTITFSVSAFLSVIWQIAESKGVAVWTVAANAALILISVPLMLWLGGPWQLEGVAIARLVGVLVPYLILLLVVEKRYLSGRTATRWGAAIGGSAVAGVACYGTQVWVLKLLPEAWWSFGVSITTGAGFFLAVCMLLRQVDRSELTILWAQILKRQKNA